MEVLRQCEECEHEREICWGDWPFKDEEVDSLPPHFD